MAFFQKIENEDGLIGIWKLTEQPSELLEMLVLSEDEQSKFKNIKAEKRQAEFLAIRLLLSKILATDTEIIYNATGKPFLKNRSEHISISHSADFVSVFISDKKVGIDVELGIRNIDRVATRFLHPDEKEYIAGLQNQQLSKIVYWSAKEAIFKCSGEHGIAFSQQIRIDNFDPESDSCTSAQLLLNDKTLKYNLTCMQIENNVLVYCVER